MFLRKLVITALFCVSFINSFADAQQPLPPALKDYIKTLQTQYHFSKAELTTLFNNTHINFSLIDKMNHPYEALSWPKYRKIFITQQRIDGGLAFWNEHQKTLYKAEQKYGVPANVIVALLGIETNYGQAKGAYPVMDTLTTLSFYYKPREKFFRQELTEYLLLTREQKLQPLTLTGSYAGAIGIPQFMPSTYRHYAVDYSNQGSADIVNDVDDAIFSTANFLNKMGWKEQQRVADPVTLTAPINDKLVSTSAKPTAALSVLKQKGIAIPKKVNRTMKAAVIKLETEQANNYDYWVAYGNFHAIMRYNPRIHYAMAVYQLSEAIKNAHQETTATRTKSASTRPIG